MRFLHGLNELAIALEEAAVIEIEARHAIAGAASVILHDKVLETFGDATKLATLAPATQEDRLQQGYSPNDPLYRDGTLLRDAVEREHEGATAGVGSAEPIQRDHEFGYINARTGNPVPPRPVFKIAMQESREKVLAIVGAAFPAIFGGKTGSVELNP